MNNHWKYLVKNADRSVKELEAQNIKGIYFEKSSKHSPYPLKTTACHLVGFTRGDHNRGIEKYYNDYMKKEY